MEQRAAPHSWVPLVYFYFAALVGLLILVTASIIAFNRLVDAIFFEGYDFPAPGEPGAYLEELARSAGLGDSLIANRGDQLQAVLRALLAAGIGAFVMFWHLRQARRETA